MRIRSSVSGTHTFGFDAPEPAANDAPAAREWPPGSPEPAPDTAPDTGTSTRAVEAFSPHYPLAERVRELRAALVGRTPRPAGGAMTLAIADPDRKYGSSLLAADLAAASAHLGFRVLLVDANIAKPDQHRLFGLANRHGVSDIARWMREGDAALQETGVRGLKLLSAGPDVDNPAEVLERMDLCDRLRRLGSAFDMILLDLTAQELTEAAAAAAGADGVILAVRRGKTAIAAVQRTVAAFADREVETLGLVPVA